MEFREKQNFLFRLTQTTGADLSRETGIVPSTVSCWKSGRRGFPRRAGTARSIAAFFAKRLEREYCRKALAEFTDHEVVLTSGEDYLAERVLLDWLSEGKANKSSFWRKGLEAAMDGAGGSDGDTLPGAPQESLEFFGTENRLDAFRRCLEHMLSVEHPGTVYVCCEDDAIWRSIAFNTADVFHTAMKTLVERGAEIVQILPPPGTAHYYDILGYWIPLYLTGKVSVLHYPRMRDSVLRGFYLLLEDEAAMLSYGMFGNRNTVFGKFSSEKNFVDHAKLLFSMFISRCEPAMTIRHGQDVRRAIRSLFMEAEEVISLHSHIPPLEMVLKTAGWKRTMMFSFSSPAEVASGKVAIPDVDVPASAWKRHTPESYAELMRDLMDWMNVPGNVVVPLAHGISETYSVILSPGKKAVVLFDVNGIVAADITAPPLLRYFEESIFRKLEESRDGAEDPVLVRRNIEEMIRRLERR